MTDPVMEAMNDVISQAIQAGAWAEEKLASQALLLTTPEKRDRLHWVDEGRQSVVREEDGVYVIHAVPRSIAAWREQPPDQVEDIVARLRAHAEATYDVETLELEHEAADEIERLREASDG